jgi:exopolysaccharide production protein ExoY
MNRPSGVRCFVSGGEAQARLTRSSLPIMTTTATRAPRTATAETDNAEVSTRPIPGWKRPLDILLVLLAAPGVGALFLAVGFYIKLVSRGPILFVQERVGFGGRRFRCLKFRTMRADNSSGVHVSHLTELMKSNRPMQKLDAIGDTRIIPLGRLLRASGLDEVPQLINVLRGEMSLVGPRPCTPYEYGLYRPWHKERCTVLPGLTGLWQVNGKNKTTFEQMMRLDIRYARTPSLGQDLKIIAWTIPALLGQVWDQWQNRRKARRAAAAEAVTGGVLPPQST